MKTAQKAKYMGIGALAMTVAVPLVIKATDAVPLTFSQGDILSADVLNTLFGRLNDVQKGFESADELVGSWTCITYRLKTDGITCSGGTDSPGGLLYTKSQTISFSKNGSTYRWDGSHFPGSCDSAANIIGGEIELIGNNKLVSVGQQFRSINNIVKKSPSQFVWDINSGISGGGTTAYAVCTKQNQPPSPPTTLSATATGTSVALSWVDQSNDETGFKVQTKTAVGGTWTTLETTAAGVQTSTATGATGNNWYRVLATNANGDSITSNEILVEIE